MHQLTKGHSSGNAACNADSSHYERLYCQHLADMSFSHSKDIVNSNLLFPALDEKTVGIKQKDHGKYNHHAASHP